MYRDCWCKWKWEIHACQSHCRFAAAQLGSIKVDGKDLAAIDKTLYQKRIGYITQDPVIFNDTIYNNVTLWARRSSTNLLRFQKACESAAIWGFVAAQKEHEMLGADGVRLSGGQKQRIAIARELFKEVDLLIMDEATAAMDSLTEKEIHESIDGLLGKVTIVSIAHRLSTIKNADRIIFLNNGIIVATGTLPIVGH